MTDEVMHQLSEALADRYLLEEAVGRGSAATVYLAQDLRHGRRVALKVLHSALGQALGVERFQREIRTQARLHHPHILPLFDSGSAVIDDAEGRRLFYVMPYVESGTLRDRLSRHGPLTVPAAVKLASEVASALAYAHALGVIHRDLKPENILLSVSGHALLTDFGIAYAVEEGLGQGSAQRLTETGVTLGTPAYMSPEQGAGDEVVDARSDIYALGTVIWEALAGRPPFEGPNARAIMSRRLTEAAPSVAIMRPDVPGFVARALARRPEDRFESAAAFAAMLAPARPSYHDTPLPGEPPGTPSAAVAPTAAPALAAPAPRGRNRRTLVIAVAGALLVGAGVAGLLRYRRTASAAGTESRVVAVLPFKNLGPPGDQYFADGLTEEITSRLAGLSGLRVISRTSADQYRASDQSVRTIGGELGADYVLEGSVRWARDGAGVGRLRVTPQLIRVTDDSHLWAATYDATLGEVFRLQSEIAEEVTTALDVALRAPERAALAAVGTRNPEAYDLYLRGMDFLGRTNQEPDLRNAARFFEQAVRADPSFAQAHARLSRVHAQIYWHHYDRTADRLRLSKQEADAAQQLAPDLPETHMALGFYRYWGELDFTSALREFEAARRQQPSNSELLQAIGYVERRQGRWEESLARFVEALRYDPRSGIRNFDVGDNYFTLHMYPEAERYLERARTLSSDWSNPYIYKAWLYVSWRGDLAAGRALLREGLSRIEAGRFAPGLFTGDRVSASLVTADSSFAPMLESLSLSNYTGDSARYHMLKAEAAMFRRDRPAERAHADSALGILEVRRGARPDDGKLLAILSLAYSHLGRHAEAVRVAERAAERIPVEQDAVSGPFIQSNLALIHMAAGHYDRTIAILERLLNVPGWITPAELRADPIWAPLRSHPRFRTLAAEIGTAESR
jgi:TolB-like protein/tRNA A-37 threonylcarbamoyl transferase component Bud32/Tfp pilus assembly protein PilF